MNDAAATVKVVGYRHSREEILDAATAVALDVGMAKLTFARVGAQLGISDRMVVYYFPTKPELVMAVAGALGASLMSLLEDAFGTEPRPADELARRAWPALATDAADRIFALYFEVVGLAGNGEAPYDVLAPALVEAWADWLAPRIVGSSATVRRRRALAVLAQVDGLLLLRRVLGPETADVAARELLGPHR